VAPTEACLDGSTNQPRRPPRSAAQLDSGGGRALPQYPLPGQARRRAGEAGPRGQGQTYPSATRVRVRAIRGPTRRWCSFARRSMVRRFWRHRWAWCRDRDPAPGTRAGREAPCGAWCCCG